jgi:hypothetical protein
MASPNTVLRRTAAFEVELSTTEDCIVIEVMY